MPTFAVPSVFRLEADVFRRTTGDSRPMRHRKVTGAWHASSSRRRMVGDHIGHASEPRPRVPQLSSCSSLVLEPCRDCTPLDTQAQDAGFCNKCESIHIDECDSLCTVFDPRDAMPSATLAEGLMRLSGFPDDPNHSARRVLLESWSMLLESIDIVEYSLCLIFGRRETGDGFRFPGRCIRKILTGRNRITVRLDRGSFACEGVGARGAFDTVWLCARWDRTYYRMYVNPYSTARSDVDRRCIVVNFAASLLHELLHVCFRRMLSMKLGHRPDNCDPLYRVEWLVGHLLSRRYRARTSNMCERLGARPCHDGSLFPG